MKTQNPLSVPVLVEDEATGHHLDHSEESPTPSPTHSRAEQEDPRWALFLLRHMGQ
ncbi:hypothetical protein ABIE44_002684 [Marmoricola sp. OAE513]|uniref:hypothetical protein n=1 Tax=Marmoricola sp. OAE513 TaxID=2817894 RepID=UPI001AE40F09